MEHLKVILKGLWIGATMTVPGVSGGTMAVVTGIYEALIHAVSGLAKEPRKHFPFLLRFVLGAGTGFLAFAGCITFLLRSPRSGEATCFLFCGIVVGGIPLLVQKSGIKQIKLRYILWLICGAAIVLLLSGMPQGTFSAEEGIAGALRQAAGGFLAAAALILPGISVSHMLYVLGLYETVLGHIYAFQFVELFPLMAGGFIGTFLTAGLLERLLERYTAEVYMIITGFAAGSIVSLMPREINHPVAGAAMAVIGFLCMYLFSKRA